MLKDSTKQRLKKGFFSILTIGSAIFYLASCNKNTEQKVDPNPNPGGGGGGQQIEDVQVTIESIVNNYIQENNLQGKIESEHVECLQEIVGDAVKNVDLNSFISTHQNGEAVAVYKFKNTNGQTQLGSTHFDVSPMVEYYLSSNLEELLLMGINEFADTTVSSSLTSKYEEKLAAELDKILNDINTLQYTNVQENEYAVDCGISVSLKTEVLEKLESQNSKNKLLEPVTFGAPREDGSAIITGVDSKGQVWEYYFKLADGKDMPASDFYNQIASGTWDNFTTKKVETDQQYSAPAVEEQKQMVSVSDIFDEVFAGFQFADLKELLNGIAKERLPYDASKVLFAEFNDDKTEVNLYTESTDALNRTALLTITCTGSVVKDIWNYQSIKDVSELKTELLKKYEEQVEENSAQENQIKQNLLSEREKYEEYEKNIQDFDGSKLKYDTICGGTKTQFDDINLFGEKLLENEQNAQVLATYLTNWGGRNIDSQGRFDTGYLQGASGCVVYAENGQIKIYKTDIQVPHYTDSTNESLYQSILNGKYVALNAETTQIDMINTLSFLNEEMPANYQYEEGFEMPFDIYFEDSRR